MTDANATSDRPYITIVSGLPRSGTSMMMQMLEAGGMRIVTDRERKPDDDNPRGYYEFEPVKKTREDASWLPGAAGKVVKMIYRLLYDLPATGYAYRVVFLEREMSEVLASQQKMLARLGTDGGTSDDEEMAALFRKQLAEVRDWLAAQRSFSVLYVSYRDAVGDPPTVAARINEFLGGGLDTEAMAVAVDPSLYRNRA